MKVRDYCNCTTVPHPIASDLVFTATLRGPWRAPRPTTRCRRQGHRRDQSSRRGTRVPAATPDPENGERPSREGSDLGFLGSPYGIRTRAATLRGWCPRPLDERAKQATSHDTRSPCRPAPAALIRPDRGRAWWACGWGERNRTPNNRSRICCVAYYTTPQWCFPEERPRAYRWLQPIEPDDPPQHHTARFSQLPLEGGAPRYDGRRGR